MKKLYLYAPNIHQGGGKTLLNALLENRPSKSNIVLFCDERMEIPKDILNVVRVKPSLFSRVLAEIKLFKLVTNEDIVLCFGNLPPLFKLRGLTAVFLQNRYLIGGISLNDFSFKIRIRLAVERLWLSMKIDNVDEFIVQTPTMKRLLEQALGNKKHVSIMPFMSELRGYSPKASATMTHKENSFDFVYVASGEPHKNHVRLLEAWCLLAGEGLFPLLGLTLNEERFSALCSVIEVMRQRHGLKVTNLGEMSHKGVQELYKKTNALIYPSTIESFGLPLVEARQAGLQVLAPELDYVRDVLAPEQTFDPNSPVSIARAVKRYLGITESELNILDATDFLEEFMSKRI